MERVGFLSLSSFLCLILKLYPMQFGVSTFVWFSPFDTKSFDLVHKVKDMGYDILEVAVEDKDLIDWAKLKQVVRE